MQDLRPVTRAELREDPLGRAAPGPTYLEWCVDAELTGVTLWGRPSVADLDTLFAPLAEPHHPKLRLPCDTVFDGARLEGLDRLAFERFVTLAHAHRGAIAARTRRQALVRPAGMPGALFAGFNAVLDLGYEWRVFDSLARALAWLGRGDADAEAAAIAQAAQAAVGSPLVVRARALLSAQLGRPRMDIAHVARALGLSVRTLQRKLADEGASFRALADEAAMDRAAALLADTDLKLDAIAREIGAASLEDFLKRFRRRYGTSPGEWRKSRR